MFCAYCQVLIGMPPLNKHGCCVLPDQALLDSLDDDLRYAITVEGKMALEDVENYDEARDVSSCCCACWTSRRWCCMHATVAMPTTRPYLSHRCAQLNSCTAAKLWKYLSQEPESIVGDRFGLTAVVLRVA